MGTLLALTLLTACDGGGFGSPPVTPGLGDTDSPTDSAADTETAETADSTETAESAESDSGDSDTGEDPNLPVTMRFDIDGELYTADFFLVRPHGMPAPSAPVRAWLGAGVDGAWDLQVIDAEAATTDGGRHGLADIGWMGLLGGDVTVGQDYVYVQGAASDDGVAFEAASGVPIAASYTGLAPEGENMPFPAGFLLVQGDSGLDVGHVEWGHRSGYFAPLRVRFVDYVDVNGDGTYTLDEGTPAEECDLSLWRADAPVLSVTRLCSDVAGLRWGGDGGDEDGYLSPSGILHIFDEQGLAVGYDWRDAADLPYGVVVDGGF